MVANLGNIDVAGDKLAQTATDVAGTFSNRLKEMKNASMIHLSEIGEKGLDWLTAKWKDWGPTVTSATWIHSRARCW
jgi:hypothetical protein